MQGCKPCILLELSKQTFTKINFPLHWTLCQREVRLSCLRSLSCLRKAHEADWIGISQVQVAGLTDAELTTMCPEPLRNRTKRKDSNILDDGKTVTRGSKPSLPWNGDLCPPVVKCNRLQGGPLSKLAGASVPDTELIMPSARYVPVISSFLQPTCLVLQATGDGSS